MEKILSITPNLTRVFNQYHWDNFSWEIILGTQCFVSYFSKIYYFKKVLGILSPLFLHVVSASFYWSVMFQIYIKFDLHNNRKEFKKLLKHNLGIFNLKCIFLFLLCNVMLSTVSTILLDSNHLYLKLCSVQWAFIAGICSPFMPPACPLQLTF